MVYNIFLIWLLFIILINIRTTDNSLLSRFRNPNEYVPREVGKYFFPEDLDDNQYSELLLEVPELAGKLRINREEEKEENIMLPFIRKEVNGSFEIIPNYEHFDTEKDEDQEEYPGQLEYITVTPDPAITSTSTRRLPFLTRRSLNSSESSKRRNKNPEKWFWDPNDDFVHDAFYTRMATCYWCGMNHSTRIPISSLCHDAFESPDWRARTMARYFRAHCFQSIYTWETIKPYHWSQRNSFSKDNGLIRRKYGSYIGGCFKRFLDVGNVYTQRGCRSWWPKYTKTSNFAVHRFARLESLIRAESNYCIVSPHASLTPFSRSISLYVRYHVCVCDGRYCNTTSALQNSLTLIPTVILVLTLISF